MISMFCFIDIKLKKKGKLNICKKKKEIIKEVRKEKEICLE